MSNFLAILLQNHDSSISRLVMTHMECADDPEFFILAHNIVELSPCKFWERSEQPHSLWPGFGAEIHLTPDLLESSSYASCVLDFTDSIYHKTDFVIFQNITKSFVMFQNIAKHHKIFCDVSKHHKIFCDKIISQNHIVIRFCDNANVCSGPLKRHLWLPKRSKTGSKTGPWNVPKMCFHI